MLPADLAPGEHGLEMYTNQGETRTTDDNGHDEQWWKARADAIRDRLSEATVKLEIARRRAAAISADMTRTGSMSRLSATRGLHDATADIDRRAADVLRARRALHDLEEDARKAGALPGWLRK